MQYFLLRGFARERFSDDGALLEAMSMVLDSPYAHFEGEAARDS